MLSVIYHPLGCLGRESVKPYLLLAVKRPLLDVVLRICLEELIPLGGCWVASDTSGARARKPHGLPHLRDLLEGLVLELALQIQKLLTVKQLHFGIPLLVWCRLLGLWCIRSWLRFSWFFKRFLED